MPLVNRVGQTWEGKGIGEWNGHCLIVRSEHVNSYTKHTVLALESGGVVSAHECDAWEEQGQGEPPSWRRVT